MTLQPDPLRASEGASETWPGVLAGVLPFLLFGLAGFTSKFLNRPDFAIYVLFYLFVLAGLALGCARGFPRWSLVYLFWSVLLAWWLTGMWGWRAWAPPGAALLAGLLLARSPRPLRALAARLWRDWTWVTLAAYIFPAWLVLLFDENHHPALHFLMAASTLVAAAGAALYLRAGTSVRRGLGLLAGLAGLAVIGGYAEFTWDFRAYYGLPPAPQSPLLDVIQWGVLFALWTTILLGPAFASLWRPAHTGGEAGA